MAGARGGARADRVDAQLLAELATEVASLAGHQAVTNWSRLDSTSAKSCLKESANFFTPSLLERVDDVVVVDAGGLEVLEHACSAPSTSSSRLSRISPWSINASIGGPRHRVDGVGADDRSST